MSYDIRVNSSSYQLVFEDNTVIITAKFFWNQQNLKNVIKGHFRLVNKTSHSDNFKIHNALYCSNHDNLELRLSSHPTFGTSNEVKHQTLDGMELGVQDEQPFWFRVSKQSLACSRPVCETPAVGGSPDDKDGSILIGTQ